MLVPTQESLLTQPQVVPACPRAKAFEQKSTPRWISLLTPEDSSGTTAHLSVDIPNGFPRGLAKLVFWMAVAILLSLIMGQLV